MPLVRVCRRASGFEVTRLCRRVSFHISLIFIFSLDSSKILPRCAIPRSMPGHASQLPMMAGAVARVKCLSPSRRRLFMRFMLPPGDDDASYGIEAPLSAAADASRSFVDGLRWALIRLARRTPIIRAMLLATMRRDDAEAELPRSLRRRPPPRISPASE